MVVEAVRPGDFRVCPGCRARSKARESACRSCGRALGDAPLLAPAPAGRSFSPGPLPGRVRALIGVGVAAAVATGVYVGHTFRATFEETSAVRADTVTVRATEPPLVETVPDTELTWTPPARGSSAPIVAGGAFGTGPAVVAPEAGLEAVAAAPATETAAIADSGMMSITPSETRRRVLGDPRRTFTNDDLIRLRASDAMGAPAAPAPAPSVQH